LTLLGQLPIVEQFWLMEVLPFNHELQGSSWELPVDRARFDFNRDLVLSVHGVEMCRTMLAIEHANYDPEEAREFRHFRFVIVVVDFGVTRSLGVPSDAEAEYCSNCNPKAADWLVGARTGAVYRPLLYSHAPTATAAIDGRPF